MKEISEFPSSALYSYHISSVTKANLNKLLFTSRWWPCVGRRWILHAETEVFSCIFTFPVHRDILTQGMGHEDGPSRAFLYAGTAEPALLCIEHDRWFLLYRIRHHHVGRTDFNAGIASVAFFRIEPLALVGSRRVGRHVNSITHGSLLYCLPALSPECIL